MIGTWSGDWANCRYPGSQLLRNAGSCEQGDSVLSAASFIVHSVRVVDHVVKPQRQFNQVRLVGQMTPRVEVFKARGYVFKGVVVPSGLAVLHKEVVVVGTCSRCCAKRAPEPMPTIFKLGVIQRHFPATPGVVLTLTDHNVGHGRELAVPHTVNSPRHG